MGGQSQVKCVTTSRFCWIEQMCHHAVKDIVPACRLPYRHISIRGHIWTRVHTPRDLSRSRRSHASIMQLPARVSSAPFAPRHIGPRKASFPPLLPIYRWYVANVAADFNFYNSICDAIHHTCTPRPNTAHAKRIEASASIPHS